MPYSDLPGDLSWPNYNEIRGIDPLCNWINIVYKTDGSILLNSGDQPLYQAYLSSVQDLQLIWSCEKSK